MSTSRPQRIYRCRRPFIHLRPTPVPEVKIAIRYDNTDEDKIWETFDWWKISTAPEEQLKTKIFGEEYMKDKETFASIAKKVKQQENNQKLNQQLRPLVLYLAGLSD